MIAKSGEVTTTKVAANSRNETFQVTLNIFDFFAKET